MNLFENYLLLHEKVNNTNCLPIDLSSVPKKHRLLCIDSHAITLIGKSIATSAISSAIGALITRSTSLILPTIIVMAGITLIPVLSKFDAKDFRLVPRDLSEDFDSSDDGYKVKIVSVNDGVVETIHKSVRDDDISHITGNFILIKHNILGNEYYSFYSRLKHDSILVKKGNKVKRGQHIANMGNTGNEDSLITLHFELNLVPFVLGKFTENFEPHKYSALPLFQIMSGSGENPTFENFINNKLEINDKGNIDNCCFLT